MKGTRVLKEVSLGRLRIRINPLIAVSVILTLGLLINLGFWQLGRAEEKRQLQREMQARQLESAVPIAQIPQGSISEEQAQALENQNVIATGTYWNEASFVVAFQFFQGAPGFELVTPFELSDTGEFVLVSRGWIAPGPGDDGMPFIVPVDGEQTLTGQLHIPPAAVGTTQVEGEAWPLRFRRLDIARVAAVIDRELQPWVVRLAAGGPGVLARHWPTVTVSTRSNIQYALQWFGMALLVLVITVLMSTNVLALKE
ncbi:MAG: SURF1 family protein [Gammaproteobacteria bacterium]|nr:SURF1 family protein [Gammaproteobacteria bacterium]MDP2348245.1 SURF1 family protein [Gammaproteobacteria bacterium]